MYIIASAAKLSTKMAWALSNKSVLFQWVIWGALPKYRELEPHSELLGGMMGHNAPTVMQIWGGSTSFEP